MYKKLIKLIGIILLITISFSLVACSEQKTEEKLREEIEAEIKEQMEQEAAKAGADNEEASKTSADQDEAKALAYGDVNDKDRVYAFLKESSRIDTESLEDFKEGYFRIADFNNDGHVDLMVKTLEWYGTIHFIQSVEGGFKLIPVNPLNGDNDTDVDMVESAKFEGKFMAVTGENLSNNYKDKRLDLYYFDGNEFTKVFEDLLDLHNGMRTYYQGAGTVEMINDYYSFRDRKSVV